MTLDRARMESVSYGAIGAGVWRFIGLPRFNSSSAVSAIGANTPVRGMKDSRNPKGRIWSSYGRSLLKWVTQFKSCGLDAVYRIAAGLWSAGCQSRCTSHPVNAMLNYAYAVLIARVQIQLIANGYDPTLGIMHHKKQFTGLSPTFALDH